MATVTEFSINNVVSIFVDVTLDATDERLPLLFDLLRRHEITWGEFQKDHYTDEELNQAKLVVMWPDDNRQVLGGPRLGTHYDLTSACPKCGAGAQQTSALMIDGQDLSQLEGVRVASTFYFDMLVDQRLAEELENLGATGLSLRSVYAVMKDKRQIKLPWRQMCAARAMPPRSPKTTGVDHYPQCSSCTRSNHITHQKEPLRLVYSAQELAEVDDVHTTWEWFGEVRFNGDLSTAVWAYPFFLVSPKVMRVLRAAGDYGFRWLAVRSEDELRI